MRKKLKASNAALEELHAAIASELARKISSGEATAADLAVAARFVKDNGVSLLIDPETPAGSVLAGAPLPDVGAIPEDFDDVAMNWN